MNQLATVIYLRDKENNKTLMLHRTKKKNDFHKDLWLGLGGKCEDTESPEDCIIREVFEESGLTLDINDIRLAGIVTLPKLRDDTDWTCYVFECEKYSGELIDCVEGELCWIENEKLFDLNMWEGDKLFFPWVDEKKFFSAKFTYVNQKLVEHSVQFY